MTLATNASTFSSATSEMVQPPQPAPVRRDPSAPARRAAAVRASNSGQLLSGGRGLMCWVSERWGDRLVAEAGGRSARIMAEPHVGRDEPAIKVVMAGSVRCVHETAKQSKRCVASYRRLMTKTGGGGGGGGGSRTMWARLNLRWRAHHVRYRHTHRQTDRQIDIAGRATETDTHAKVPNSPSPSQIARKASTRPASVKTWRARAAR